MWRCDRCLPLRGAPPWTPGGLAAAGAGGCDREAEGDPVERRRSADGRGSGTAPAAIARWRVGEGSCAAPTSPSWPIAGNGTAGSRPAPTAPATSATSHSTVSVPIAYPIPRTAWARTVPAAANTDRSSDVVAAARSSDRAPAGERSATAAASELTSFTSTSHPSQRITGPQVARMGSPVDPWLRVPQPRTARRAEDGPPPAKDQGRRWRLTAQGQTAEAPIWGPWIHEERGCVQHRSTASGCSTWSRGLPRRERSPSPPRASG